MKEDAIKVVLTAALAAFGVYLQALIIPIIILIVFMVVDYFTGMASAWIKKELSSRTGIIGIVKKLCYLVVIAVGMGVDYIISIVGSQFGYDLSRVYLVALIVTVWLILNEFISILENLNEIGIPLPGFLGKMIDKLKKKTEAQLEVTDE